MGAAFLGLYNPVSRTGSGSVAFFARPMARIDCRLASFFSITVGAGANLVLGSALPGITDLDLLCPAVSIGIRNR